MHTKQSISTTPNFLSCIKNTIIKPILDSKEFKYPVPERYLKISNTKTYGCYYNSSLTLKRDPKDMFLSNIADILKDCDFNSEITQILADCDKEASQIVSKADYSLVVLSHNILGPVFHKHAHVCRNNLNYNHTYTKAIPLTMSTNEERYFYYSFSRNGYEKLFYEDIDYVQSQNLDYKALKLRSNQPTTVIFDSYKNCHYVNHTADVVLWYVLDGVEFKDTSFCEKLIKHPDQPIVI